MAALAVPVIVAPAKAGAQSAKPDLARVEALIVARTNDFRREQGLPRVGQDPKLAAAARYFADYMARTERYGHEADGKEPADRATAHGYDYCLVAENIAYQYSSADFSTAELASRNIDGWKGSSGHRRNMLSPHAIDTGVAVARSAKGGRYYAVQMFGRPKSASVEFQVTNNAREAVRYRVGETPYSLAPGSARIHTICAPQEVALAGARSSSRAHTPRNGDRLLIVREPGGIALRAP